MVHRKTTNYKLPTTNWRRRRDGISLIELITGFAVAGLVLVLIASLYFSYFKLFSNQNTSIEVSSQNKVALDEIINQIRQSQSVVSTCSACTGDTTGATVVVLQLWPLDPGGEPFDPGTTAYDYVVYKRDATNPTLLLKRVVADVGSSRLAGTKIMTSSVTDLQFAYDNASPALVSEVTVTLTTSLTSTGKTQTSTQTSKAVLRNK